MERRPLLPERATFALSLIASLVLVFGGIRVAEAVMPGPAAIAVGVVLGLVALVGIPTLLGRPDAGVMLLAVVGGLVIVIGFISGLDDIGLGTAVAIYLPASLVLIALVWAVRRFLVPARR
jgi:hypothetical protein